MQLEECVLKVLHKIEKLANPLSQYIYNKLFYRSFDTRVLNKKIIVNRETAPLIRLTLKTEPFSYESKNKVKKLNSIIDCMRKINRTQLLYLTMLSRTKNYLSKYLNSNNSALFSDKLNR